MTRPRNGGSWIGAGCGTSHDGGSSEAVRVAEEEEEEDDDAEEDGSAICDEIDKAHQVV
jgi:hypothetical protein